MHVANRYRVSVASAIAPVNRTASNLAPSLAPNPDPNPARPAPGLFAAAPSG